MSSPPKSALPESGVLHEVSCNTSEIPVEPLQGYCAGGYHPVRIGDKFFNDRYEVVNKLGYGVYSTVWLCYDSVARGHVAMKVLTSDCYGTDHDTFEISILARIKETEPSHRGANHVLGTLDSFTHQGPNGKHVCVLLKPMGPNLQSFRLLYPNARLLPKMIKQVSRQLVLALVYLHETCKVIHTDIKPANILVETNVINELYAGSSPEMLRHSSMSGAPPYDFMVECEDILPDDDYDDPAGFSVRLSDFGVSSWFDKHLTEWIQPQALRAPEVILGAKWDASVDIWNLGLVLWELEEGKMLCDGCATGTSPYTPAAHLSQMQVFFGPMPKSLLARSANANKYYNAAGELLELTSYPPTTLEEVTNNPSLAGTERKDFVDFIGSMLKLSPEERPSARELLAMKWLEE